MPESFDLEIGNPERFNTNAHERREDEIRDSIEAQYNALEDKTDFNLFADKHNIGLFTNVQDAIFQAFQFDEGDTKFKVIQ